MKAIDNSETITDFKKIGNFIEKKDEATILLELLQRIERIEHRLNLTTNARHPRENKKCTKLIKELEAQNISRYKLSQITGIAHPSIYNAIDGKIPMYDGWKMRIAEALGKSEEDLF